MVYTIRSICTIVNGELLQAPSDAPVEHLVYDTRRVQQSQTSLFFAIHTEHNNGHKYLEDAYALGVRNFMISEAADLSVWPEANVIRVADTLIALQCLAAYHRRQFTLPVIGITGSNGKTIVKEWLYQLLQDEYSIIRSPKSYNSQLGVALSVWQINEHHTLGIFEAGISTTGEMERLQPMILPDIGILTNLGEAHAEGFTSREEKALEKLKLFEASDKLLFHQKDWLAPVTKWRQALKAPHGHTEYITWNREGADTDDKPVLQIRTQKVENAGTRLEALYKEQPIRLQLPFTDTASIENAIHCWLLMLQLGYDQKLISERFSRLHSVEMRLQLRHGVNECIIINDSYSADLTSLEMALQFLAQQSSGLKRTVILSDLLETGRSAEELYAKVLELLKANYVRKLICIGPESSARLASYADGGKGLQVLVYTDTDVFLQQFKPSFFNNEIILIKGARRFGFERIALLFERRLHQTVLEINLNALAQNLKAYRSVLSERTRIMAMVKAFSYGSGGAEIASVLQYHRVNYLGVAYADEGVELRKAGIYLPIMVMNAEPSSFPSIVEYELQPVLYSSGIFSAFEAYIISQGLTAYPVHAEVETGMNRLGFAPTEIPELANRLAATPYFRLETVFTHLAASEDPAQDEFTKQQAQLFRKAVSSLSEKISYPFLKHLANSAAIIRHPELQMDMVRLGIGLYGVEVDSQDRLKLTAVARLRSTVAQLKKVKAGESISYNRKGIVTRDSLIATIRIGYADGYSRRFGNGKGSMWVRGQLAPVIGTVCMDMTMIDVTEIPDVQEGDDVILFGPELPVQTVAGWIDTIPYELMTSVSHRVKRIYFHE
ncbi:MAG TPA: bifunctional UDP-N-acetylmuramoyl-tripeptide:D-alanyl-D-alanine ligase/alanine racemase [Flavisolibacter sp.]|jgi:alanine racemase|nr:bifunctional UDP-N-acetylmuramoyl-tripeptide:D-alanyl-D-alanine ligase/alanine racemase [Flavisolibacter sp.]